MIYSLLSYNAAELDFTIYYADSNVSPINSCVCCIKKNHSVQQMNGWNGMQTINGYIGLLG